MYVFGNFLFNTPRVLAGKFCPFALFFVLLFQSCFHEEGPARILVFSKTEGYRHESIPTGVAALRQMCKENGMLMDSTEDAGDFNENNLKRYAAVVFLNTTGDVLSPAQEVDFERYIQSGGGYVGIHSATDTEYGWTWYGGLSGAYFKGHPAIQDAKVLVKNHKHPATEHLNSTDWMRKDEWYNFKDMNPNVDVLLALDESSYQGGDMCSGALANDACHPISWSHEYDGGRAFYTGMGHTKESYSEPEFLKHLLGGLKFAIGNRRRFAYENTRTHLLPDPTRFVKTVLVSELTEPMELDMFPDGKVILIERRGTIKLFDHATGLINVVYKMPVYSKEEDGLMGLALDPNWEKNHWIYLYYSPLGDESVNVLSRFIFVGDTLDRASEKIILKVGVQRQECCHTGGSIEFDTHGRLFLSTGDNTNPFASEGYDPIDEMPGRSAWDAQKSSGNTNDLRGKIIRIKPLDDGTYICPAGNLFNPDKDLHVTTPIPTAGGPKGSGRPEIYVMGCRNPFRISVDSRRNLLFWGEVGPDSGEPDSARGPAGHDEVNRAAAAGFYGWPYFVGNNKPYREYDFRSKKSGPYFDPLHPVNNSPYNTGRLDLPPAQPALIWYPYNNSPEFPLLGNGGRNAMAGPVYYCDQYPAETRLPDYYNGKLITYDWMRGWMMAVTLDSLGNFSRMEPFADSIRLSRPMDMIVDKHGSIWVLEYGTQWFASNADARLSRIDYIRGNRPPIPSLQASKMAGAAPLQVVFSVNKTKDYDSDKLSFELDFGDGTTRWTAENKRLSLNAKRPATGSLRSSEAHVPATLYQSLDSIVHTFNTPGTYEVKLSVRDENGAFKVIKQKIAVGNEAPVVHWDFGGKNRSFYLAGDTLHYRLTVNDAEDGSLDNGGILPTSVATSINYLETGFDITSIAQGHQANMQQAEYARGKTLIDRSDCKTCHALDRLVNGPSFQAVASRYRSNEFAIRDLSKKVIKGGAGVWGQTVMSAHPLISEEDAGEMVRWILSLGDPPKPKQSLPVFGDYVLAAPAIAPLKGKKPALGTYIFQAGYRDRGSRSQASLEEGETIALRPAFQQAERADSMSKNIRTYRPFNGDTVVLIELKHRSFFLFKRCDLNGIHSVSLGLGSGDKRYKFSGGRIELHLDAPNGPLAGSVIIPASNQPLGMAFNEVQIPVTVKDDMRFHDLYFVIQNKNNPSQPVTAVDWIRFELGTVSK